MKRRPSRRRTIAILVASLILLAIAIIIGAMLTTFAASRDKLPHTTYLADVEISGLTIPEAINRARQVLAGPLVLRYGNNAVPFLPASIDFKLNDAAAQMQLDAIIRRQQGLDNLPDYLTRRSTTTRLPAPYQYSESKLDEVLLSIAGQFDHAPRPPQADPAQFAISPGQDGETLSLGDAKNLILGALATGLTRTVDLPLDIMPASGDGLKALGDLIQARLADFTQSGAIAGVYIKDLTTGRELALNGDVAFSAPGWLKLATAIEMLRVTRDAPDQQLRSALASVIVDGQTANADDMLRLIGLGDAQAGAMQINTMLKKAGLVNTFIAQPFSQATKPIAIVTPANSRADINASPDPRAQSTPIDAGLLLEALDQCRSNTGALILAFGGTFTGDKCNEILNLMARRTVNGLIQAASPGATVIGRQSWDDYTHADAALVRSPGGDYIVSVMLHSPTALNWAATSVLIADVARAAFAYFNHGQTPPAVEPLSHPPPQ